MSPALELLRLLAQDVSTDRLDERARQLDAPEDVRRLALAARAVVEAHRRREAELTALVDTARDLASAGEPGGVLDAIVRRARSLLGTDVAYLTLSDAERGDTYMRATAGSVSARFQELRLPAGAGLGGLVAQTRRPYWTADYPGDERYAHTSEIDGAVDEEGLVAICGTPLLVDGEFVGVLFAANRTRRPFHRAEVALLGSLAALAAVSLVQARRAAETAAALAELSAAHAAIQEAAQAHDRFTHVVLSGGGVDDIAAALGGLLGCWVAVLDADGQRIAVHGTVPASDLAASAAVQRSAETGRLADADGFGAVAVRAAGQQLGTVVLGAGELDGSRARTVERAATVTALVLLFRLRAAESDQRVRTDLLADLLARPAGELDAGLVERGRLLGLRLQREHVLVVADAPSRALVLAATDAGAGRGLVDTRQDGNGELIAVVPGTDPSAVAAGIGAADTGATVAATGPVVPGVGLRDALAEARRIGAALAALGRRTGSAGELGFAGLVGGGQAAVDGYVRDVLGPVLDHDARHGTHLAGTLDAWFAAGGSPLRASAALHVHVNTVTQRLERVSALLGEEWSRPGRALEVQLALHLRRLRDH